MHPPVSLAPAAPVPVAATRTAAPLALPLRLLDLIHSSFLFLRVFRTATNFNCTSLQFVEICCTSIVPHSERFLKARGYWGLTTISIWNDGYIKTLGGRFSAALFMISQYESTYSGLLAYILHMNTRFPRVRTVLSKRSFHQPVKNQRLPPKVNHRLVVIPVC